MLRTTATTTVLATTLLLATSLGAQVTIENLQPVDVTLTSFTLVWGASAPTTPSVTVYADPDGLVEVTDQLEVTAYPLTAGDPSLTDEFALEDDRDLLSSLTVAHGLVRVRVAGCEPGVTYYYRAHSGSTSAPSGPPASVTTAVESAFVSEACFLVVTVDSPSGVDPRGWLVSASTNETSYPISAVVGDGVAPDRAFFNLTTLFDLSGATWIPSGSKSVDLSFRTGNTLDDFEVALTVDFDGQFTTVDLKEVDVGVPSSADSDFDGLADAWEILHFGDLHRDGSGDFDGDGVIELVEFERGGDPTRNDITIPPRVYGPLHERLFTATPDLQILNRVASEGPYEMDYDYQLQIIVTDDLASVVQEAVIDSAGAPMSTWMPPAALTEDAHHTIRVRATSSLGVSCWSYYSYQIDEFNSPPGDLYASWPMSGTTVASLTPTLEVTNSTDSDAETLFYNFEVYSDAGLTILHESSGPLEPGPTGTTTWTLPTPLTDGMQYFWIATATDGSASTAATAVASFVVDLGNAAPSVPQLSAPAVGSEITQLSTTLSVDNSTDTSTVSYYFELDRVATFDSPALLISGPLPEGVTTTGWMVTSLADNTLYYWRAKASDGAAESAWTRGEFFVNVANEPPPLPVVKNPGAGAWVGTQSPALEVFPASDVDRDVVEYAFEVYADAEWNTLIAAGTSSTPVWSVDVPLDDLAEFHWRARAIDDELLAGPWSSAALFVNTLIAPLPAVDAGDALILLTGDLAQLDGSDTYDPAGGSVDFSWKLREQPPASVATVAAPADVQPLLTPDLDGDYLTELIVSNGRALNVDWVWHRAASVDVAPNADAGEDVTAVIATPVVLDASESYDADAAPSALQFSWSFDSLPAASSLTDADIVGADQESASFTPDVDGAFVVRVVVSDGALSSSDAVIVFSSAQDVSPNADAGDDFVVDALEVALLDGGNSEDPDSAPYPLTYSWHFASVPDGSTVTDLSLLGSNTELPEFVPDVAGDYLLRLTISDGEFDASDNVVVRASLPTGARFIRGDMDGDGGLTLLDAIYGLDLLFQGTQTELCRSAADVNDDGSNNIADVIYLLRAMFLPGAPMPPPPFPGCGVDGTSDSLPCLNYPAAICP